MKSFLYSVFIAAPFCSGIVMLVSALLSFFLEGIDLSESKIELTQIIGYLFAVIVSCFIVFKATLKVERKILVSIGVIVLVVQLSFAGYIAYMNFVV